jgi:hypothetical protein
MQSMSRKRRPTQIRMSLHSDHNLVNNNNNNDTRSNRIPDTKGTSKRVNKTSKIFTPKCQTPQIHKAIQATLAMANSVVTAKY